MAILGQSSPFKYSIGTTNNSNPHQQSVSQRHPMREATGGGRRRSQELGNQREGPQASESSRGEAEARVRWNPQVPAVG